MFYLKKFFHIIFKYPIKGSFFIFFTLTLIVLSQQEQLVNLSIEKYFEDFGPSVYFWGLVKKEKVINEQILEQIRGIPSIKKITLENEKKVSHKIKTMLSGLDLDIPNSMVETQFTGIKIVLDQNYERKNFNLAREYLIKLLGEDQITLGPIRHSRPLLEIKSKEIFIFVKKWGYEFLLFLNFLIWCFAYYLLIQPIGHYSYLIERYQRRNQVSLKIMLSGFLFLILIAIIPTFVITMMISWQKSIMLIIIFILSSFFTLKINYESFHE